MTARSALSNRPDRAASPVQDGGERAVWRALEGVDDPEYPGVSIVELGLVAAVRVAGGRVEVDLVPTFSGCPALAFIAADVRARVAAVPGVDEVTVTFVAEPVWTPERIAPAARERIAARFGVAVQAGEQPVRCPRCGARDLETDSLFGPVRCRSVQRCRACGEIVETIR